MTVSSDAIRALMALAMLAVIWINYREFTSPDDKLDLTQERKWLFMQHDRRTPDA